MVVLLRSEEVPKDIICTICLSVPSTPCTLRSCSHVFCENCIRESISHRNNCPVCRRYCSLSDVQSLKEATALGYRIWNSIMVKCDNHESGCSWTGSISDYRSHKHSCPQQDKRGRRGRSDSDQDLIGSLQQVNFDLESILGDREVKYQQLKHELDDCLREISVYDSLEVKYQQLKHELDDCLREISAYDSFYVPKVAVRICQNLKDGLILKILKHAIVIDVYTLILRKFVIMVLEIIAWIVECSLVYAWQVPLGSLLILRGQVSMGFK